MGHSKLDYLSRYCLAPPLRALSKFLRIGRVPKVGFRILLFHDIPAESFVDFEKLISYVVSAHGVLTPDEAASCLSGDSHENSCFEKWNAPCLLSFDDGFYSNLEIAKTVLSRHGIKALFFVTPGLIDLPSKKQKSAIAKNVFQARVRESELSDCTRLLHWEELCELKRQGHVIGCHGLLHRRLSELSESELVREIVFAGDLLDRKLQQKTDWYAYAFGDINSIHDDALQLISSRYRYCRSGLRGINNFKTLRSAICSDSLVPDAPLHYQKLLIEGGLDFLYSARRRTLHKMSTSV